MACSLASYEATTSSFISCIFASVGQLEIGRSGLKSQLAKNLRESCKQVVESKEPGRGSPRGFWPPVAQFPGRPGGKEGNTVSAFIRGPLVATERAGGRLGPVFRAIVTRKDEESVVEKFVAGAARVGGFLEVV